ncbi:hypothetical protein HYC85_010917 [Camellia sinensis]|uniref:D-isomer specific 2-hydroxyacid dehydrogenase catalytic domain-containing protein n=1 Tax=Camellia sinensis TaxID=4442 RepID=A0A7J7HJE1_CAMSI|nr:hypothetical protein HYC85_010917 [Camellia sinensis]
MEHHRHPTPQEQEFPQLLVLRPPVVFTAFHHLFIAKFQVLKAYESPLPIDLFLTTYAQSVRAVLCAGSSPITANVLSHLPSLQVVVSASAGINHIDFPECRRRDISVANAGTIFSEDVADVAVVLLIDVLRKITGGDRFVRRRDWPSHGNYPLGSKTDLAGGRKSTVAVARSSQICCGRRRKRMRKATEYEGLMVAWQRRSRRRRRSRDATEEEATVAWRR